MKSPAARPLLTFGNPKAEKGEVRGYLTALLHLAPASLSGRNVCASASPQCIAACLNTAGRGGIFKKGETGNDISRARMRKTLQFFDDRDAFLLQLYREIGAHVARAARVGMLPAVRLNATSDVRWEAIPLADGRTLMEHYPAVPFYDYTKHRNRRDLPANYSLTFSRSETNHAQCLETLARGDSVAVVFATRKGKALPETWSGYRVIDGDLTDLRFLDPRGVVVGLRAKGRAIGTPAGFVVPAVAT